MFSTATALQAVNLIHVFQSLQKMNLKTSISTLSRSNGSILVTDGMSSIHSNLIRSISRSLHCEDASHIPQNMDLSPYEPNEEDDNFGLLDSKVEHWKESLFQDGFFSTFKISTKSLTRYSNFSCARDGEHVSITGGSGALGQYVKSLMLEQKVKSVSLASRSAGYSVHKDTAKQGHGQY